MKIIFLDHINSTQDYLKNILESQGDSARQNYLIHTGNQTQGHGRQKSQWDHTQGSLACSFNMMPHSVITLSALEIAVLISDYFSLHHQINIQLKWPNDLFFLNKKLGGIIIQAIKGQLIIGIGINHTLAKPSKMRIGTNLSHFEIESFINYIHENRIQNSQEVKDQWLSKCLHRNQYVSIDQNTGQFIGLGEFGQALLKSKYTDEVSSYIAGSLRYV